MKAEVMDGNQNNSCTFSEHDIQLKFIVLRGGTLIIFDVGHHYNVV